MKQPSKYYYLCLGFIILFFSCSSKQINEMIIYHKFEPTASDLRVIEWNISSANLPKWYIKETIDQKGRVKEVKFFENDKIFNSSLCYLASWIKYEYPNDNTIVEYKLNSDSLKVEAICGLPYKEIFLLDKNNNIVKCKSEYFIDIEDLNIIDKYNKLLNAVWECMGANFKFDTTGLDYEQRIVNLKNLFKNINNQDYSECSEGYITYYWQSFAKLNGRFPVGKEFDINMYAKDGVEIETIKKIIEENNIKN